MVKQTWKQAIRKYLKKYPKGSRNRMTKVFQAAWHSIDRNETCPPQVTYRECNEKIHKKTYKKRKTTPKKRKSHAKGHWRKSGGSWGYLGGCNCKDCRMIGLSE